jgi:flagellar protein FliL
MAKGKEKAETKPAEEVAAKPKKSKLVILVVMAVLLLGGGGGAAWFLLMGQKKPDEARQKDEKEKPPVYVSLERKTYNLPSADGADHFLMIAVDVKVEDDKAAEKVKLHMPEILNGMLMLISSKTVEELATLDGKKKLSAEIVKVVNEPMHLKSGEKGATDGLLTEFVIQ